MSTNAVIRIQGVRYCEVYKHWDGYPENTLPWLEKFNKYFAENRGDDPSYKIAQLLRSSVRMQDEFHLDPNTLTGWGITTFNETSYEYLYTLHTDGRVTYEEA